jgi:hypothetical protein
MRFIGGFATAGAGLGVLLVGLAAAFQEDSNSVSKYNPNPTYIPHKEVNSEDA